MTHESREYQDEVYDAVFDHLFNHEGNGVVAAPGGVGKSHIMNRIIRRLVTKWQGTRVLSLVHDAKVIKQNHDAMLKFWKNAPVGIYSAGLKRKDTLHPIIYAGIQSVAKRVTQLGTFNVIFVDECDLLSPKEETYYQKLLSECRRLNPKVRVLGFTATPYRLGTGCLTNLDTWDRIIIDMTKMEKFNFFVDKGYLSPLVTKKPSAEIDVKNISMKGNDFDEHSMQEVTDTDELNQAVVDDCIRRGPDRKHWLVFSAGIKHGTNLTRLFNSKGVVTKQLSGKDTMEHRAEVEKEWREGKVRCLVNCGRYGRGFDFPAIDLIAIVRATQSVAWWIQACVRGTRTVEGKDDCIARGQRVLTDQGLVPIEKVTCKMKVWDGLDFVSHSGAVCRGNQHTITYAGLTATPDHKVKTVQGWKTLRQSFIEQTPIRLTGADEQPLREASDCFRYGGKTCRSYGEGFCANAVRIVQHRVSSRLHKCFSRKSRLSKMWKKTIQAAHAPAVALQSLLCSPFSLHKPYRPSLRKVWWKRYSFSVRKSNANGGLGSRQSGTTQRTPIRQDGQQRSLRTREPKILHSKPAAVPHATTVEQYKGKPVSVELSRNTIRRRNLAKFVSSWFFRFTNCREVLPTIQQTKREVWDILNCGPRNCFTCEGLLVHNCLILDYGGNIRRLGPVNDPIVPAPRRKGQEVAGEAPLKVCPQCFSYVPIQVKICPDCQYVFPPPKTIEKKASSAEIMVRKGKDTNPVVEEFHVLGIRYQPTLSKTGKYYLRVTYSVGTASFHEAVWFDHATGPTKRSLEKWWLHRGGKLPIPDGTDEAGDRAHKELMIPSIVRVDMNTKYKQVVGVDFDPNAKIAEDFIEDDDIPFDPKLNSNASNTI